MKQLDPIPQQIAEHCNKPEKTYSIEDFNLDQLNNIASQLADLVADGKAMEWRDCGHIYIVSRYKVELELAENVEIMAQLITKTFEEDSAQQFIADKFMIFAKDMIYDNILSFETMPLGYEWEDYA